MAGRGDVRARLCASCLRARRGTVCMRVRELCAAQWKRHVCGCVAASEHEVARAGAGDAGGRASTCV